MAVEPKEFSTLKFNDKEVVLPVVTGTEGEKAVDITGLRRATGLVALDPGYVNTASCYSQITYIDGEKGILRYRGIPIEELVQKVMFIDVAYLLVHGELPDEETRRNFSSLLNTSSSTSIVPAIEKEATICIQSSKSRVILRCHTHIMT